MLPYIYVYIFFSAQSEQFPKLKCKGKRDIELKCKGNAIFALKASHNKVIKCSLKKQIELSLYSV